MLLLSAVLVYAVSFVGVKSGRLKNDISWAHPIFVALFTNDVNDAGNISTVDDEAWAVTKEVQPEIPSGGTAETAGELPVQTTDYNGNVAGKADGNTGVNNAAGEPEISGSCAESAETEGNGDTAAEGTLGTEEAVPEFSGKVEYVTTEMRHARSGYYSDFDTVALTSDLDYVQVDNDYFSDACFIGDSRMEGLYFYGDLREADFYYKPGSTVYDIMDRKLSYNGDSAGGYDLKSELSKKQYSQIYMMVGVNELGDKNPEEYAKAYAEDIATIRQLQPDAVIFIIGMMHVTTQYSNGSDVFNNDNIDARNTAAAAIANGEDIFYLDMNECVDDGNGGVIGDYSFDGVHLKAEYYKLWTEWMKAHGTKNLIK